MPDPGPQQQSQLRGWNKTQIESGLKEGKRVEGDAEGGFAEALETKARPAGFTSEETEAAVWMGSLPSPYFPYVV